MAPNVSSLPVGSGTSAARRGAALVTRFLDLNKQFCRRRLQPRLYAVSQTEALDSWFSRRVKRQPGATLLEFGCGRTFQLTRLLGDRFARCYGTDLEDVAPHETPAGVVFERCTPDAIPFADGEFDCIVVRSVIEHVTDPAQTFAELHRVTRGGGRVLMNLPNKWDYVSMFARLSGPLKSWILTAIVRMQFEDFPVAYRCNTRRAMYRVAARAGFDVEEFVPLPLPPSYLSFFVPLYVLGAVYQFLVSICGLDMLQPAFLVVLRKPVDAPAPAEASR
jgi:SAM-dependent methyltransferase